MDDWDSVQQSTRAASVQPTATPAAAKPTTPTQTSTAARAAKPAPAAEAAEGLSAKELEEMLRRVNLTFDLFEIAAHYRLDEDSGRIRVTVFNTHTGEVIRRIPPEDFRSSFDTFREGLGLLFNRML